MADKLSLLYPERMTVQECDMSLYDVENTNSRESFRNNCFIWINTNLIDVSISLNSDKFTIINELIGTKTYPKNLRYLETTAQVVISSSSP